MTCYMRASWEQLQTCVVNLDLQDDELISRCVHRRMDPVTGKMYHLKTNPPEDETIAARIVQRDVDREQKITDQLNHYKNNSEAVCQVYANQLKRVDGECKQEDLSTAIDRIIDETHAHHSRFGQSDGVFMAGH